MLAGLVAITAPCAFVDSWAACVIGAIAGVLVVLSVFFWDRVGVDDPVGAISVHGVNGLWGVISRRHLRHRQVRRRLERRRSRGLDANGASDGVIPTASAASSTATPASLWAQLLRRGRGRRVRLRHGLRVVQDQQPDHAASASAAKSKWKASTVRKWALMGYSGFVMDPASE